MRTPVRMLATAFAAALLVIAPLASVTRVRRPDSS